ncbi:PEP-utilizing enzyme [Thermodesulfobacteriota bacterium]
MDRQWTNIELDEPFDMPGTKSFFMDGVHTMPRWQVLPLDHIWPMAERGLCWGTQKISHPQCKGWIWRTREGSAFLTPIMVTDPEEVESRKEGFREQLAPFIEDFPGLWEKVKKKWDDIWDRMFSFDLEAAADFELEDIYRELLIHELDVWKDHFFYMQGIASVNMLFEDLATELCGVASDSPMFTKLTSGYESKAFDSDKGMWKLGKKAEELGLADLFKQHEGQELVDKVKAAPKGDELLKELDGFNEEYGKRLTQLLNYATPTWAERPDIVLTRVATFVKLGGDFRHDEVMVKATKEREEAEKEILAKIPDEQKEWFAKLMKAAQNWNWWSEEHEFWLNEPCYTMMRQVMLEYGKRFVKGGAFDNVDDIFHIREKDFERVIHAPNMFDLRPEVARHRAMLDVFNTKESNPVVCYEGLDAAMAWLAPMREVHVTLTMGKMPNPIEGKEATLWGSCGCPGTVEGIARVVMSEDQLPEIQPGEIVVCPTTYVTWTPIFSVISGLVVDRGGTLSHAAICSREHGIPCILNTFVGTAEIKTGQKIKIEADIGAIYVIE